MFNFFRSELCFGDVQCILCQDLYNKLHLCQGIHGFRVHFGIVHKVNFTKSYIIQ